MFNAEASAASVGCCWLSKIRDRISRTFAQIGRVALARNNLRPARALPFSWARSPSMLKITRHIDSGRTTLTISGRLGAQQLSELRRSIDETDPCDVVLDLLAVSLVDTDAVRFLVQCEQRGVRVERCPAYVREWMAREQRPPP